MHANAPLLSHLALWLDDGLFTAPVLSLHREHTINLVQSTQTELHEAIWADPQLH